MPVRNNQNSQTILVGINKCTTSLKIGELELPIPPPDFLERREVLEIEFNHQWPRFNQSPLCNENSIQNPKAQGSQSFWEVNTWRCWEGVVPALGTEALWPSWSQHLFYLTVLICTLYSKPVIVTKALSWVLWAAPANDQTKDWVLRTPNL